MENLHIEDGTKTLELNYRVNTTFVNYGNGSGEWVESVHGLFDDCPLKNLYLGRNISYKKDPRGIISTSTVKYPFENQKKLTSVTIGDSVTDIRACDFFCTELVSIYLLCEKPPYAYSEDFTDDQYVNMILYVPTGTLETYQNANPWKNFWDIQEFDATGINDINASNIAIEVTANGISLSNADGANIDIYTLNGTLVKKIENYTGEEIALNKGIYFVHFNNNTIKVKV